MSWFADSGWFLNHNLSLNLPSQNGLRTRLRLGLRRGIGQCRCGPPRPQPQPPEGFAPQLGDFAAASPPADANTENFLASFPEPQWGHFVPCQSLERTRISLSRSHSAH